MDISLPYRDEDELHLQHALLVYASTRSATILRADVHVQGGQAVLGNAHDITQAAFAELLRLAGRRALTLVPPHVVAVSSEACAWWVSARSRTLRFNPDRDTAVAALDGRVFPQPPLMFISAGRSLRVYALAEDARPQADTPLMRAPYYNVFDGDDQVCTGNAPLPPGGDPAHTEAWETMFFHSNFTHRAGRQPRWASGGTHVELWEAAAEKGAFDPAWLVPAGVTLAEAVCGR